MGSAKRCRLLWRYTIACITAYRLCRTIRPRLRDTPGPAAPPPRGAARRPPVRGVTHLRRSSPFPIRQSR